MTTLPLVVKLPVPAIIMGELTAEIIYRRKPQFGDMKAVEGLGDDQAISKVIILTARLAGIPQSDVEKFDLDNMEACAQVIGDFFPTSRPPKTGAK